MDSETPKIERLLKQVAPAAPPAELRERVLSAAAVPARPLWPFIETLAACLLVAMNLALAVGLPAPHSELRVSARPANDHLHALGVDPELAGAARFAMVLEGRPAAPRLDVTDYRLPSGEL